MVFGASKQAWEHWAKTLGLGQHLLPVVSNPKAPISPNSSLVGLGKVPSLYNGQRQATGIKDWPKRMTSAADLQRWSSEPDFGICVQARAVRAIDIDIPDPALAGAVVERIETLLPWHIFARRYRADSGKLLLPFRYEGPMPKRVIPCADGIIEFLGDGQQWIAEGTHTGGQRYQWAPDPPMAFPALDTDDLEALWAALVAEWLAPGATAHIAREKRDLDALALSNMDDPVVPWLIDNWEVHDADASGTLFIECPFADDHTTASGPTATAYYPAGTGGYEQGHFVCLHAHCAGRTDSDFLQKCGHTASGFPILHVEDTPAHDAQPALSALPDDRPWPKFNRTPAGEIKLTMGNLIAALERPDATGLRLAYDDFRDQIICAKGVDDAGRPRWRAFDDNQYTALWVRLEDMKFKALQKEMLKDAVHHVAFANRVDIAKEWLNRLQWDGVERVARFFPDYLGTEDSDYARALGFYAWTAHAGRVLSPGCQADMAIILKGAQGLRKTSSVAAIAPHEDMYSTIRLGGNEDNLARKLRGKLVGELEELRGLNSVAAEEIRAWISRRQEKWVVKYKEFEHGFMRRLAFWGTGNEDEILGDATGERRWLPIEVGVTLPHCDSEAVARDRNQLWAEGAALFRQGGVAWREAERLASAEHFRFKIVDAWDDSVALWLTNTDSMSGLAPIGWAHGIGIADILTGALGVPLFQIDTKKKMRVGKILAGMGLNRRRVRLDSGHLAWRYFATSEALEALSAVDLIEG